MPAPLPGSGAINTTGPILGTGKGQLRGFLPNIFSMFGGGGVGGLGGGYAAYDPLNRKRRPMFTRRYDQNEGMPGGGSTGGGGGIGTNRPDPEPPPTGVSMPFQSPYDQPLRQFGGNSLGNPYTLVPRGSYDNDEVWRMYRSQRAFGGLRSRPRSGMGGMGAGFDGMQDDPIKKLLLARYGGGV